CRCCCAVWAKLCCFHVHAWVSLHWVRNRRTTRLCTATDSLRCSWRGCPWHLSRTLVRLRERISCSTPACCRQRSRGRGSGSFCRLSTDERNRLRSGWKERGRVPNQASRTDYKASRTTLSRRTQQRGACM